MKILSSRRLLDGEVKVLLDYLAENAQQVEMSVDNIDDWAYDKNFVGKLSHYVGKATLKIKYQSSNNIGKAIERKRLIFRYDRKNPRLLFSSRSTLTVHI